MTFLAPAFLFTLLALPVLVLLGLLHKRPRRMVVPSTEIWAEVARKLEAASVSPRPTLDRRLLLALAAALLAGLAAAGLAVQSTAPKPRDVCVLIDRSGLAGEPAAAADAPRTALDAAIEWTREFGQRLNANDRLEVRFSPSAAGSAARANGLGPGPPTEVLAALESAAPAVVATDGATLAADALAALPASAPDRLLVVITPQGDAGVSPDQRMSVIGMPVLPRLRFERFAPGAENVLIELASPVDLAEPSPRGAAATCDVRIAGCDASGVPIPGWSATVAVPVPAAGQRARHLLPMPANPSGGEPGASALPPALRVDIADALPPVRAAVRRQFRVLVHPATAYDPAGDRDDRRLADLRGLIAALCPAVQWVTDAPFDCVLIVGSAGGAQNGDPRPANPLPMAIGRSVPALALGRVPEGVWPLAATEGESRAAGAQRLILEPLHPLLAGVSVADLPLDGQWWPLRPGEGVRARDLLRAGTGDDSDGDGAAASLLVTLQRGPVRGIALPGATPAGEWVRRGGLPAATLLANALAWLTDDPAAIGDATDWRSLWRAGTGDAPDLPPWVTRALDSGTRPSGLDVQWFDRARPHVGGWVQLSHASQPAGSAVLNAPTRYPPGMANRPPSAEEIADRLPAARVSHNGSQANALLLLALAALAAFAVVALRRS